MKHRLLKMSVSAVALAVLMTLSAQAKDPAEVTINFLETSDVHGHLTEYDYESGQVTDGGLVRCATIVKQQRELDPNLILVDCGDITQGNMVSEMRHDAISPAILALNNMKYDVWELGNHEFNFEFDTLLNHIKNFAGTVLAGNIYKADGKRFAAPYVIKNVKGLKVAIIGMDAPHVPIYESDKSHYDSMTFKPLMSELDTILKEVKAEKPDVTVVLCHYGETGEKGGPGMYEVGQAYADKVDAFLIGHAHSTLLKYYNGKGWEDAPTATNSTCLMETGCHGKNVGKLSLTVAQNPTGAWKVKARKLELLSCKGVEPDAELSSVLKQCHETCMAESNRIVGEVSEDFHEQPLMFPHMPKEILEEGPLLDLVHDVLFEYTGADVAIACLFKEGANVKAGPFRVKDACAIYPYDNTAYKLKITGAQLKAIMEEHAGKFFNQFQPGDLTISFNNDMRMYSYDTFGGVNYKIDISKPVGERIVDLTFKGKPLAADQELTLAVTNYRYGQLVQEKLITPDNVVDTSDNWANNGTIRAMICEYIRNHKTITPKTHGEWSIIGYKFEDPQKDIVYDMIREGKIEVPVSVDGRTPNNKSINANELRAKKILPPLDGE